MPVNKKGTSSLNVYDIPIAVHKKLRQVALDQDTSVNALMKEGAMLIIQKYTLPRSIPDTQNRPAMPSSFPPGTGAGIGSGPVLTDKNIESLRALSPQPQRSELEEDFSNAS